MDTIVPDGTGMGLFLLSSNFNLQFCKPLHCRFCYLDPHPTLAYGYFPLHTVNTNSRFFVPLDV